MSDAIFTSQLKNKEKMIDATDSKGRPIRKYQTHVFLPQWAKFDKVVPFQNVKCVFFCVHQWANFDKVFPFQNIKCLWLWNGQGLPSVRTLTWHLVLNKPGVVFVQFHQNQPNSRVACMILPLYVAMPWTYRRLLSCDGNEWFKNIWCIQEHFVRFPLKSGRAPLFAHIQKSD